MATSDRQKRISKQWRKCGFGRLYWKSNNRHWRNWDSDVVAVAIDSPVRMLFKSVGAIEDFLIETNCGEK